MDSSSIQTANHSSAQMREGGFSSKDSGTVTADEDDVQRFHTSDDSNTSGYDQDCL